MSVNNLHGRAMITTPTDGAVRDVKKVVDTGKWPSSQNGQVVGVAGSSAITDIVGSAEVAHDVVIDFGAGQEPEPTPDPEPTPEPDPDPMPSPEQKPDLKPVDKDAKTTTTVTKTVTTKTAAAKNASDALAATGDSAATAATTFGIAGASVIGAGFVASKLRNR